MIWTFKIALAFSLYADEECERILEIDCSSTLEDLHLAIQEAVNFENDHLYEFYISRTETSLDRIRFDDENGKIYDLTLEDIYPLDKGKKLFYLFDYGDHWLFKISKTRKKPHQPEQGIQYPRVIEKTGKNPEQYPEWEE